MESLVGRTLCHYQVLRRLGRGGMGEVFVAQDSRLGRRIALKTLPSEVAQSPDRRKRFEREARALAALNHPHIVTVHSVEECDDVYLITMELLEGDTLAELMPRNGFPIQKFFDLAIPLADAVSSAHAHGVIHRDLKPTNIMVTDQGHLKVLDFGLARIECAAPRSVSSDQVTQSVTEAGWMLGTVSCMSPEQVEGKAVDHRTDVFSMGIVFYEMLTGQHPFLADTPAATLSAILRETPRSVTEVNPLVPRELARVVRRCLSKDPARRYQSCLDLRNDLEDIRAELSGAADSGVPVLTAPRTSGTRMRRAIIAVLAVGLAVMLASMMFKGTPFGREPSALPMFRFHIAPPEGGMFTASPSSPELSLSPDGRHLAFVATTGDFVHQLWVRPLDSVSPRVLAGTEGASLPFWSPDGRHLGFFAGEKLKKIDVSGGPPQTLAEGAGGGTWNSTGDILFGGRDGLYLVPSHGGEPTRVTQVDPSRGEVWHRYPRFLPDDRHFLYLVIAEGAQERGIYTGSIDSGEKKRLLSETSNAEYAAPGYLFFVRESALLAVPFDATRLALVGEPTLVADSVIPAPTARFAPFSLAADVLAYRPGGWAFQTELTWIDRKGQELGTVGTAGLNFEPSLSPDEKRVAFSRWDTHTDIWTMDLSRNLSERLTAHPDIDFSPVWSPDGEHIVFRSSRRGTFDLYRKASNGTATEELVVGSALAKRPHHWSADGRFLLFEASNDVWVLPMTGDKKPFPFLSTRFLERQPQLSPDGKWIAFTSDESGAPEVYVREFREGGKRWRVSTRGGFDPKWQRDGKELFYLEPGPPTGTSHVAQSSLMAVRVTVGPVFEAGPPRACFRVRVPSQWMENVWTYAVTADGQRFLFSKIVDVKPSLITVVLNWREALQR